MYERFLLPRCEIAYEHVDLLNEEEFALIEEMVLVPQTLLLFLVQWISSAQRMTSWRTSWSQRTPMMKERSLRK